MLFVVLWLLVVVCCSSLSLARCAVFAVGCLLFVCLLACSSIACCLLFGLLFVVWCVFLNVCRLLVAVCCLLFAG